MTDPQRDQIVAAIERELARSPFPPELRGQAVRDALDHRSQHRNVNQSRAVALVAALLAVAIVTTLVLGSRAFRPAPAQPNPPPSPRAEASVVYDDSSGQLLVFGGTVNGQLSGYVDETWTWDGTTWTQQHPASSPPARTGAPIAYDPIRHVVVMFGGLGRVQNGKGGQMGLTDTWTWDGRTWTLHHTSNAPPPAQTTINAQSMAFDPISGNVLYYMVDAGPNVQGHTWAWTGADWKELHPTSAPNAFQGSLTTAGDHLLLIAQPITPERGRYLTGTWSWDGSNWRRLNPRFNLPATGVFSVTFDVAASRVVAFDGDTWTWDGTTWLRQHPLAAPSRPPYMVYFRPLGEVIAWGNRSSSRIGDLWAWDTTTWHRLQAGPPVPSPAVGPTGALYTGTPAEAESAIRKTVAAPHRVLLPVLLQPGLQAAYSVTANGFTIGYATDERDQSISLDTQGGNAPPSLPQTSSRTMTFRGVTASYHVLDATSPLSMRWLVWTEPGVGGNSGTVYLLITEGFADQEFWQIANSLK